MHLKIICSKTSFKYLDATSFTEICSVLHKEVKQYLPKKFSIGYSEKIKTNTHTLKGDIINKNNLISYQRKKSRTEIKICSCFK